MNPTATPPASIDDDNKLIAERREKLKALRDGGGVAFPNDFKPKEFEIVYQRAPAAIFIEALEPVRRAFYHNSAACGRWLTPRVSPV